MQGIGNRFQSIALEINSDAGHQKLVPEQHIWNQFPSMALGVSSQTLYQQSVAENGIGSQFWNMVSANAIAISEHIQYYCWGFDSLMIT